MKKTTLVAMYLLATASIYSQETIPISGGDASGNGGSSSYTIGQLLYTTHSGGGTLTQGIQQSIELYTLTNPNLTTVNLTAGIYPNPASDYVVLAISDASLIDLNYVLYDILGRTVAQGQTKQDKTQINMQGLEMGTYVLKINQARRTLKSFKIIKN